jgi:acetyl-CoA carboxylase biotin carboxyl carrier protein
MSHEIAAEMAANVWKVLVREGDAVAAADEVVILESMKMEIPLEAGIAGVVTQVLVTEGAAVVEGQPLVAIDPA